MMVEAETLAKEMCERVRERRLRRIGELPPDHTRDWWEHMPEDERRNWIDAAETAMEVMSEYRQAGHPTERADQIALLREDLAAHMGALTDSIDAVAFILKAGR